ncbi:hypothetical protein ACFE04_014525 [Oxalis oulophora]
MGCVSSNLLNHEDELTQLGTAAAFNHHIVKLTSTTYGLLSLDPPQSPTTPPLPPPRFTHTEPEVINWPDSTTDSFRFSTRVLKPKNGDVSLLDSYERLCPPNGGDNKIVIYTTTLRGVRKTFESCNAVRSALEGFNVSLCERDVSMDRGFREELKELMKGKGREESVPPRVFVKGRYIGGVDEVIRLVDEGQFGKLLVGLEVKKNKMGGVCQGCGDVRFLPCFTCSGSCKVVTDQGDNGSSKGRCPDCNENGLVLCPICS